MTYKKVEKIRKEFESLDLSRYRVLTLDEMLKVNGGGSSETEDFHVTSHAEAAAKKNAELDCPKGKLTEQTSFKSWWEKEEKAILLHDERNIQRNIGIGEMILGFAGIFVTDGYGVLPGAYIMADGAIVFSGALQNEKVTPLMHFSNDFVSPVIKFQNSDFKYVSPF